MAATVYIAIGLASAAYILIIVCPLAYYICCWRRKEKENEETVTAFSAAPESNFSQDQQTGTPEPIVPSVGPDLDPLTPIPESTESAPPPVTTEDCLTYAIDDADLQGHYASVVRDKDANSNRETREDSRISNGGAAHNDDKMFLGTNSADSSAKRKSTGASGNDLLRSRSPRSGDSAARVSAISVDAEGEPIYSKPDLTKKLSRRSTGVKDRAESVEVPLNPLDIEPRTPELPPRADNLLTTELTEQNSL